MSGFLGSSASGFSGLNRRELIKRSLALGSLPYVAPMILGASQSVLAQPLSGTGCSRSTVNCEDGFVFCGGGEDCACGTTTEGPIQCLAILDDEGVPCTSSAQCGPNAYCLALSVGCGTSFCLPVCGAN
jgi:hypothetical protein